MHIYAFANKLCCHRGISMSVYLSVCLFVHPAISRGIIFANGDTLKDLGTNVAYDHLDTNAKVSFDCRMIN